MLKITVDNFQSLEHVEVEVDGFTALVGRSNIGKSALIRAVKYALTGAKGSDFVRHSPATCARIRRNAKKCKCHCTVRIEIVGKMTFKWEKGDAVNQYTVWNTAGKKQVYTKVERGNLHFLEGFEPLKVGDDKVVVQVGDQFKPIFLLGESGSVAADVLGDVAKLDDLNEALRLVEKDRRAAVSERKVRVGDLIKLEDELKTYDGLDEATTRVREVEADRKRVEAVGDELDRLLGFLSKLEEYAVAIRALRTAVKPELPVPQSLQESFHRILDLRRFEHDYEALVAHVDALETATKPALMKPPAEQREEFTLLTGWSDRLTPLEPQIVTLEQTCLVELPKLEPIHQAREELKRLVKWLNYLKRLKVKFLTLTEAVKPKLLDPKTLKASYQQFVWLCQTATRYDKLAAEVEEAEARCVRCENEVTQLISEFEALGACPTCEQRLEPGHRIH